MNKEEKANFLTVFGMLKGRMLSGPRMVLLHISSRCNLQCRYCWFHSPLVRNNNSGIFLDRLKVVEIIDQLKALGVKSLLLSGDGEPWLHPEIIGIIDYIKNSGMSLQINTNLTFRNEEVVEAFGKCELLSVNLSAPNNLLYGNLQSRHKEDFSNLVKNLELYIKSYKKNSKPYIRIIYTITKNNYRNVVEMLKLADFIGIPFVKFKVFSSIQETNSLCLSSKDIVMLKKIISGIDSSYFKTKTNLHAILNYYNYAPKTVFKLKGCLIGYLQLSIELNGDLHLCCHNHNLLIGNINNTSIKKAWFGHKAECLRLIMRHKFDLSNEFWDDCRFCSYQEESCKMTNLLDLITKNVNN